MVEVEVEVEKQHQSKENKNICDWQFMAVAGKRKFRWNIKKKESEGTTESMKIDQLSVNAVFV